MRITRQSRAVHGGIRFVVWLCCLLPLFAAKPAHAMNLDTYDLDSLVSMSSDIVQATLERNYTEHNLAQVEIKVTAVFKGGFKLDQSVAVTALDFYRVPNTEMFLNTQPLQIGETFFFFLVKAQATFLWDIPNDANIYLTVPSGLKLVRDNKVIGFAQFANPGPYAAELPELMDQLTPASFQMTYPTPEDYGAQIRASIKFTDDWAAQLKLPTTLADAPKLMQMLRERSRVLTRRNRDTLAEAVSGQLAMLHDPKIIFDAISLDPPYASVGILASGLGTPAGRDALLAQIGNEQEPLDRRIDYARMLMNIGADYRQTLAVIDTGTIRTTSASTAVPQDNREAAGDNNAEYLTRIARLIVQTRQHEELTLTLLQSLDFLFRCNKQTTDAALQVDIHTALAVLKTLYDATPSELLKYRIEVAASDASHAAYALPLRTGHFVADHTGARYRREANGTQFDLRLSVCYF